MYIKKMIFKGTGVADSSIEFKDGLNIVYGPSNTGKSYITEAIDYMFGASSFPLDENTNYSQVEMHLSYKDKTIVFIRKINENTGYISGYNNLIPEGNYPLKSNKITYSDCILKLLGIDEKVNIYMTEDLKPGSLTVRVFNQFFICDEDDVHKKGSILIKEKTNPTFVKSALLYLLNGLNYITEGEDNKKKEAKRKALEAYLNEQLTYIENQRNELIANTKISVEDMKAEMDKTLDDIVAYESIVNGLIENNQLIISEISKYDDKLNEGTTLLKKYEILKGQYESDIKRLLLLIDGEKHKSQKPKITRCPFCNGELQKKEEESCLDAAKVEISKITPKISDLKEATKDLEEEINTIKDKLNKLFSEKKINDNQINNDLKPKIVELRQNLIDYTVAIENSKEASMLLKFEDNYKTKLLSIQQEKATITKFVPNDLLNGEFISEMNQKLDALLKTCKFENYQNCYFDLTKFDVVTNGKLKSKEGKGYRAFINTIMLIALNEYMAEHAIYKIPLLIIDSPILTLKEKDDFKEIEDKKIPDNMKSSLFKYLVDNHSNKQIIIIENQIPNIDYKDANLINFTRDDEGRYGLLPGLK